MMYNRVSTDGYFSAPDGNLNWIVPDDEVNKAGADSAASTKSGTVLFGRRTYEMFASFWPNVREDSSGAPDPHNPERGQSPEMLAMAKMLNASEKFVFSKTLKDVTWHNSHILREFDPHAIEAMKNQPGEDIIVFGSGTIVSQLTDHGLIDEYQLVVSPIILGSGKLLFSGVTKRTNLRLLDAKTYSSGNITLRYAPA
jgi:dihydrofolate reductase